MFMHTHINVFHVYMFSEICHHEMKVMNHINTIICLKVCNDIVENMKINR